MATAIIAFGSNLDQPQEQVRLAMFRVAELEKIHSFQASSLYLTAPVGYEHQPDFVNAVAIVETDLSAEALLHELQTIENEFGRVRTFANAPRVLDLDLIDFNQEIHQSDFLTLPHPRAHERGFVMIPLAEIAPDYRIGAHGTAQIIATNLPQTGIEKIPHI